MRKIGNKGFKWSVALLVGIIIVVLIFVVAIWLLKGTATSSASVGKSAIDKLAGWFA